MGAHDGLSAVVCERGLAGTIALRFTDRWDLLGRAGVIALMTAITPAVYPDAFSVPPVFLVLPAVTVVDMFHSYRHRPTAEAIRANPGT